MKCYMCNKGNLIRKKTEFKLYGESLGKFDSDVCSKCGEVFYDEKASDLIDAAAKQKGLWGLEATTKIAQAGDSLVIRINKKLAEFMKLKKGEEVKLHPESKDKLIIEM